MRAGPTPFPPVLVAPPTARLPAALRPKAIYSQDAQLIEAWLKLTPSQRAVVLDLARRLAEAGGA